MRSSPEDRDDTTRYSREETERSQQALNTPRGAVLTCLQGPTVGRVFALAPGSNVIGRASDAEVHIQHDGVSRRHAKITEERGRYLLEDLDSTNGTFHQGRAATEPVELRDGDRIGIGAGVVLRFALLDELEEKMTSRLYELATRDALTGIHNRRYFEERLDSEWPWAQRHSRACAILVMDLDHFKRVNDTLGHPAGDYVLEEFSRVVRQALRREDLLARFGGEEFTILCRATGDADAAHLAERLRSRVEKHLFSWRGNPIPITVSIGVATSSLPGITSPVELLERADQALYRAKQRGRNRVELAG
jgi:diguanylate cyclase (GGDEF)-like protein